MQQPTDSEIRLLRVFQAVVRHNGFSAAQVELNISVPAISKCMSQLEDRLGVRLCDRGQRGFKLTEEGRQVYEASDRLFAALDDFKNSVTEAGGSFNGEIRFGLVDNSLTNPNCRVGEAIRYFNTSSRHNVQFNVFIGGPRQLEQRVIDNRLHAATGLFHHRVPVLSYEPVYETEHTLYCGKGHALYDVPESALTLEALAAAKYASRGYMESFPGAQPPISFNAAATTSYIEGAALLVLSGDYIAYLPNHYARQWVEQGLLRPLLSRQTTRRIAIHLITRKNAEHPSFVQGFIDSLRKHASPVSSA